MYKTTVLSFIIVTYIFAGLTNIPGQSTTPIYMYQNPSRNFACLCKLMMTVCVDLFRDVLDFYVKPAELHKEIRDNFDNLSRLTGYQTNELVVYRARNCEIVSLKCMDLSMLYIVIRSVCFIPKPTNGWGRKPETDDRSLAANIERIRISGIKVLNDSEEINETDYQDIWRNLRTNIDEIQKLAFQKGTYAEAVDELFYHKDISTRYIDRFQRLKGIF